MADDNPADDEISAPFKELAPNLGNTPVAPAHGIAAIALSMAMKYTDIATVQDGTLYQQYKLEGKNLQPLHLDHVFEVAMKMEAFLLGASERIAKMLMEAIEVVVDEDSKSAENGDQPGDDDR